ncbi:MAG: ABC transporter permease [Rickettsiales bacterium]|nr:ABC transporter permease [Rickettsiales bacterium]
MNSIYIISSYIRHKSLHSFITVLIFALGIAIISALMHIEQEANRHIDRNLQGVDLVVGAKGSPMQLILSSLLHIDIPTGNIALKDAQTISHHPLVALSAPIALGDSFHGNRIVGTQASFFTLYKAPLAQGRLFDKPLDAVLGSDVASRYHLGLGDRLVGSHGLTESDDIHSEFPYTVTGILAPTGTVLDSLILTPLESVWRIHAHEEQEEAEEHPEQAHAESHHEDPEVTALLVRYKSPLAAASLPRFVNSSTSMQAASPAFEVARLMQFAGLGTKLMSIISLVLVAIAALALFAGLYKAADERRYDLTLMRCLGMTPRKLFALILGESLLLSGIGALLGIACSHALIYLATHTLDSSYAGAIHNGLGATDGIILLGSIAIGFIAGALPAWRIYRLDMPQLLARR